MAHPFTKQLEKALRESSVLNNQLFEEAEKLRKTGYSETELREVLRSLRSGRIDENEVEIIDEALIGFDGD